MPVSVTVQDWSVVWQMLAAREKKRREEKRRDE
jgi:hypothetical protein